MNFISAVDMFKIGIGPSSSHTFGPWRAALRFMQDLRKQIADCSQVRLHVEVDLYGSLAQTGRGHGSDIAIICGLQELDYASCETKDIVTWAQSIRKNMPFSNSIDSFMLHEHPRTTLAFHSNGMRFLARKIDGKGMAMPILEKTYYSIGGGFVVEEHEAQQTPQSLPYPITHASDLLHTAKKNSLSLADIIRANEVALHGQRKLDEHLQNVWSTMLECMFTGCQTQGILPGGLNVQRRAYGLHAGLMKYLINSHSVENASIAPTSIHNAQDWLSAIMDGKQRDFANVLAWVSTFALAVNEQNAAFNRVVTAPTNGAAGVIPATLMYALCFLDDKYKNHSQAMRTLYQDFLLVASTIGGLFKQKATISAAMGGCQAEIGVSSAMAAAGLAYVMGASAEQTLMAAEIAMEHHLGLTCDPVAGLVQIPCIERNTMGAIKAITAAHLALQTQAEHAKVSLDDVITTMWHTALDMHQKYKESAQGGLALQIPVSLSEC